MSSLRVRFLTGMTALFLLTATTACGPEDSGGSESLPGSARTAGPDPGCRQPGPITKDLLPALDGEETRTVLNPCLAFADLVGEVTNLVPDQQQRADISTFIGRVGEVADRVAKVADAVECAYERDRLAIAIYQSKQWAWSLGVVAVVRGSLDAVVEGAVCYLLKQFELGLRDSYLSGGGPVIEFCFDAVHRRQGNENLTVLWLGSSDFMCADLSLQIRAGRAVGDGITATVKAVPNLAVRAGPTSKSALVGRVDTGAVGLVTCYLRGEKISGRRGTSDLWDQITVGAFTGYVADVWMDTGGDITTKTTQCAVTGS